MADAFTLSRGELVTITAENAIAEGEVYQLSDGRAGYADKAIAAGDPGQIRVSGIARIVKLSGIVLLDGDECFWDASASNAHFKTVNDRDFFLGTVQGDTTSTQTTVDVALNVRASWLIDVNRDAFDSTIASGVTEQIATRAKVGATAGWVIAAADNLPYVATLAASQTGSTLILPLTGLRLGDTITGFTVISQIESAGGTVTIDGDLRAVTNVAADPTDASISTMTQVSVTADTASAQAKTGLTEVVTSGKSYYLKLTATTAAATDIILQHCEVMIQRASNGEAALVRLGGAHKFTLTLANQAQKVDLISVDGFSKDANAIVEIVFTVPDDGAGTVVDVSLGVANSSHATDGDAITEHVFVHLDANATAIKAQSKDGVTTVAATDTTKVYVQGAAVANRVTVTLDMRNPADVQIYVDHVLVLSATVFNVNAAVGPFFLLAHIEKTVAADAYQLSLHSMRCRIMEK